MIGFISSIPWWAWLAGVLIGVLAVVAIKIRKNRRGWSVSTTPKKGNSKK